LLLEKNLYFKDEDEEESTENLNEIDKINLRDHLISKKLQDSTAAEYLSTVSKAIGMGKFDFNSLYNKLSEIEEIAPILRVVQFGQFKCSNFIQIMLDFNQDSISDLFPGERRSSKGICLYKKGIIHIGAKCDTEAQLLGTLAHELTHLAMQIIYQNECSPYYDDEHDQERRKEFQEIIEKYKNNTELDEIIRRCFECYDEKKWPSELIVRISHVLAFYGKKKGEKLLRRQVPELFEYFRAKTLSDCEKFIENGELNGEFNEIETLNLFSKIIHRVESLNIKFTNASHFKNFLRKSENRVLLIQTQSPFLSSIRLYQCLRKLKKNEIWKRSLFLTLEEASKSREEKALKFKACEFVIVEVNDSNRSKVQALFEKKSVSKSLKEKRVIFLC